MSVSLKIPFCLDGGRVKVTSDTNTQVQQKIVNVVTTSTFERVALPNYGGNISALVFENLDSLEFEDFKIDLAQEVSRTVTGVTILNIIVQAVDTHADITIVYSLPLTTPQQFTFRVAIPGVVDEETPL